MIFQEAYLATGIGSFPHLDGQEAFRLVLESFPDLPFWPQLPKRSFLEGMVAQYSEGFPSLKWNAKEQKIWVDTSQGFDKEVETFYSRVESESLEPFRITEAFSQGFHLLEEQASRGTLENVKLIKGQITGPVTFGLSLTDQEKIPLFYDPTLREILLKHLSAKARWMERRLNALFPGAQTVLFFDEPSLSSFGSAFSSLNREEVIASLNECFASVRGLKGVHCCGNTDWSLLLETDVDILSFDAYGYLERVSLYSDRIRSFLDRGGILAWGIIPTDEAILKEDTDSLVLRFQNGVDTFRKKGVDPDLLLRSILTPSCGTASLPVPLAERVCRMTAALSARLREKMGFPPAGERSLA
jgi:hypothetical protein